MLGLASVRVERPDDVAPAWEEALESPKGKLDERAHG